jgi:hypothetical protein
MNWTPADLIGWAIGIATLLVGLWAAVFATRSDRAARAANRWAAERHARSLAPRVHCVFSTTAPALHAEVFNLGAATPSTLIFAADTGQMWSFAGSFPEQSPRGHLFQFSPLPMVKTSGQRRIIVSVAKDIEDGWWDNQTGKKIADVTTYMNGRIGKETVVETGPNPG